MKQYRDEKIDILKGIGIIFIVLGHTSFPFSRFLYLFHISIFIMASGYFWNDKKINSSTDLKKYIFSRIKKLYIPYIICNTFCVILNNILININIFNTVNHDYFNFKTFTFEIIKTLLFNNDTELFGATWFLRLLFMINILFAIIEFTLNYFHIKNKIKIQVIISIVFLLFGYYISQNQINLKLVDSAMFMCYGLFVLSTHLKELKIEKLNNFLILTLSFLGLIILNKYGRVEMSMDIYTNILYFVTVSILGWLFTYSLSHYLSKIKYLKNILKYIGENSIYILIYHFISFKIINIILVVLLRDNITLISAFPTLYKDNFYWIIYTVFGIIFSIIIGQMFKGIKIKIKEIGGHIFDKIRCSYSNL